MSIRTHIGSWLARARARPIALLAIVSRELRVASRRPATYRVRFMAALGALALVAWRMVSFAWERAPASEMGRSLFITVSVLAFIYCLFAGVRATSDCISEEKRGGTLGLLFLTDLKGIDVVLGKLAATSLPSLYGLLAVFPVLAIPIVLGGVTLLEFAQVVLILLNTLFFSLAAGLFVSSVSINERKAASATVLAVLSPTLVPAALFYAMMLVVGTLRQRAEFELVWMFLPTQLFNPILSFVYVLLPINARDMISPFPGMTALSPHVLGPFHAAARAVLPASWYAALPQWTVISPVVVNLVLVHLLGWAALLRSARILPEVWKQRPAPRIIVRWRDRWQNFSQGTTEARRQFRDALLTVNPFYWLSSRDRLKPHYAWLFLVAMVMVWFWRYLKEPDVVFDFYPLIPTVVIVHTFLKIWVVAECSQKLVDDQRSGALELLLSTPLRVSQIGEGQLYALRRQFAVPFLVLCLLELVAFSGHYSPASILMVQAMLVADTLALMWVSMWFSLSARSLNQVILLAAGLVLTVPTLIFMSVLGVLEGVPTPRDPTVYEASWVSFPLTILAWFVIWRTVQQVRPDHVRRLAWAFLLVLPWCAQLLWVTHVEQDLNRASPRRDIPFEQRILIWFLIGLACDILVIRWARARFLGRFRDSVLLRFDRSAAEGPGPRSIRKGAVAQTGLAARSL